MSPMFLRTWYQTSGTSAGDVDPLRLTKIVVSPDVVSIDSSGYSASFNNRNAGTGKPVTVGGVTLSGAGAGNYTV